jgi:hypothetical protein
LTATALVIQNSGKVRLRSRNDNAFTTCYPGIVKALAQMPDETVIDGEVVALDEDGRLTVIRGISTPLTVPTVANSWTRPRADTLASDLASAPVCAKKQPYCGNGEPAEIAWRDCAAAKAFRESSSPRAQGQENAAHA